LELGEGGDLRRKYVAGVSDCQKLEVLEFVKNMKKTNDGGDGEWGVQKKL